MSPSAGDHAALAVPAVPGSGLAARARVLYVLAIAIGIFWLERPEPIAALCALQGAAWLLAGLGARELASRIAKLVLLSAFLVVSFAASAGDDPSLDRWVHFEVVGTALPFSLNLTGAAAGAAMSLRILAVVLAARIARAGDPRSFAAGLRGLGLPAMLASSIDVSLALFGDGGRRGRGDGTGGGRGRGHDGASSTSFVAAVKSLASGDQLVHRFVRRVEDAEDYAVRHLDPRAATRARDVAVIAGAALAMLGVRALKLLPSIPFAPGHKLTLLTPLYVAASFTSRTRFGGTASGLTMGTLSFLMGDGRYGVLEVPKHVAPGVLCDLLVPVMTAGRRRPGAIAWMALGGVVAAGRFATIFLILLAAGAPRLAWMIVLPGLAVHVGFGLVSGYLTAPLVRALEQWRDERELDA